eukprot:g7613.t1
MFNETNIQQPVRRSGFLTGILIAQISIFIAAIGGMLVEILDDDALPMVLTAGRYFILAVIYGVQFIGRKGLRLEVSWWKYFIYAAQDTAACYSCILALKYTTLTSWALIQPASLIVAIPLTAGLLTARYSWKHLASASLTVVGAIALILSDASSKDEEEEDHSSSDLITGDLLAFLSACLIALSWVIAEIITKSTVPKCELIAMLSLFGFCWSTAAAIVLGEISPTMFPDWKALTYSIGVCACHALYYIVAIIALELSGTSALQVSMLCINAWSILGRITVLGGFHPNVLLFSVALLAVVFGVVFYALSGDPYVYCQLQAGLLETDC